MIFPDTSFLLPLYVEADAFHAPASRIAARFTDPLPLTWLGEIEVATGLHRALASGWIGADEHRRAFMMMDRDVADRILLKVPVDPSRLLPVALRLAADHFKANPARTLDLLHVASAVVLGAKVLASFDIRQRALAKAGGLELLPKALPKRKA
jgi:predicted nucleic acid-binding protein